MSGPRNSVDEGPVAISYKSNILIWLQLRHVILWDAIKYAKLHHVASKFGTQLIAKMLIKNLC